MRHMRSVAALIAFCALAHSFNVTVPNTDLPLNLSSSAIDVDWSGSVPYSQLDIWFYGTYADGSSRFGYAIASNLSVSDDRFIWDPRNVSRALQETSSPLSKSNGYYFKALLHNANSTTGMEVISADYQVTGYPYLSGGIALQQPSKLLVLMLLVSVVAFWQT